jgi:hypothetical protein
VCARCAHAPGLLAWLEEALAPLPFAMCFSAAEERAGGILALPNGFSRRSSHSATATSSPGMPVAEGGPKPGAQMAAGSPIG